MRRHLLPAVLLIAAAAPGLAQAPRTSPAGQTPATGRPAQSATAAPATGTKPEGENQMRRQLAAPLRNQFDFDRAPWKPADDLKTDVVTPEMWLYQQEMRRYNDPLQAVRQNAATRANQRRSRLAAQQWFGFSNTRPQASPVPFMDMYSPTWMSNSWNPYGWIGSGHAWSQVRVEPIVITR
jgi:hypothetical protein